MGESEIGSNLKYDEVIFERNVYQNRRKGKEETVNPVLG